MGNEFYEGWGHVSYDVVKTNIRFNRESNWILSSMDTKNYQNQQESKQTIQLAYNRILSK